MKHRDDYLPNRVISIYPSSLYNTSTLVDQISKMLQKWHIWPNKTVVVALAYQKYPTVQQRTKLLKQQLMVPQWQNTLSKTYQDHPSSIYSSYPLYMSGRKSVKKFFQSVSQESELQKVQKEQDQKNQIQTKIELQLLLKLIRRKLSKLPSILILHTTSHHPKKNLILCINIFGITIQVKLFIPSKSTNYVRGLKKIYIFIGKTGYNLIPA